ncbi:MAG: hypothetical protein PVF89_04280 [Lysobacterales bacterium]|jgi:hypothetical protein
MGKKSRKSVREFDADPYMDFDDDELDEDLYDFSDLSKDFYSTEWDNPAGRPGRLSTRRRIERRNDLKELYSQFDEWDEIELGKEW